MSRRALWLRQTVTLLRKQKANRKKNLTARASEDRIPHITARSAEQALRAVLVIRLFCCSCCSLLFPQTRLLAQLTPPRMTNCKSGFASVVVKDLSGEKKDPGFHISPPLFRT